MILESGITDSINSPFIVPVAGCLMVLGIDFDQGIAGMHALVVADENFRDQAPNLRRHRGGISRDVRIIGTLAARRREDDERPGRRGDCSDA